MSSTSKFTVTVEDVRGDWHVTVDYDDGQEYAKVQAAELDVALRMAVPYMACLSQPDPFHDLIREA